ncbi:aminotransferase class I/II-fold pyridoxal phosphate-dependent enzyme [Leeuwenhoekiella sp. A16]|uniref:aminotransferase class I/II-fold pyridoxal phosphate-dependent enzyme n=1 Tax=Leeuwenhoekiella sp. A16 TaxID=3141462 RepID=UPI003A8045DC
MAKIRHNNFLDTVVSVMSNAKEAGALHLYAEGKEFNGRYIQVRGKKLFHFGTTGYLGLEQDSRLKEAAIDAISRYGTQFPLSKSYISHPLYAELESLVGDIYQHPIIITKNSTLGHIAVIPSIVNDGDGVILDHQVHWSVQNAVNPLKLRSVPVEMIRHSNLQMLEDKIKKLQSKCNKIWYMVDGIYSMYGDYAPIRELMKLAEKYTQLHIYFDDVHGMSWKGRNGSGYVMSVLNEVPENVILFGTLSKTFGASGAVMVCRDIKTHKKIRNFGGPLTFSAQLEPSSVGAAIASAKIHLSDEIYSMQTELQDRISYFNACLKETTLPLIAINDSPVFYIGTGMPETGYNLVNRLIREGFYVNTGIFPAVPVKNTGLRITISRHNQKQEIKALVHALEYHFLKSLEDTQTNLERVNFAFGRDTGKLKTKSDKTDRLSLEIKRSINEVDKQLWNKTVGTNSLLDWEGLSFIERVFKQNELPEHNYEFYYFMIKDADDTPLLLTFFTYGLWKEDMLAPTSVSVRMEKERIDDPYLHTSSCLSMGSFVTEGAHLYLERSGNNWKEALALLIGEVEILEKQLKPQTLIFRDFATDDNELNDYLHNKGFVKVAMPESAVYDEFSWKDETEYMQTLSSRSRKHFKKEIAPFIPLVKIEVSPQVAEETLDIFYTLYLNVKQNNPSFNTFDYPKKLMQEMNVHKQWEFICLQVKQADHWKMAGVMFCYINGNGVYVPNLIGMDYAYTKEYQVYRQLLYQTILRAKALNMNKIDFGLTAGFEKRKVGARVLDKCAYIQTRDNFALEALDWLRQD